MQLAVRQKAGAFLQQNHGGGAAVLAQRQHSSSLALQHVARAHLGKCGNGHQRFRCMLGAVGAKC